MDERWRTYVAALTILACTSCVRSLQFSIDTTWNGGAIDHAAVKVFLSASPDQQFLFFNVSAPFFNDPPSPPGPAGQPFYGLWDYEVVEAFFLNDANQYLEVEICPWGQHIVLLLKGKRDTVRHSLQMKVTTHRDGSVWRGSASIPTSYLPEKVTKFNAYAIHGSGAGRVYESLYPAPNTAPNPDFHALQYFKPIDFSSLLPAQASDPMSQLWSDALRGLFRYNIATTWDSRPLTPPVVQLTLQGFEAGVEINVTAPFYNDPPPKGEPGQPFYGLWDYEVVEMFFLNKNDEYLEIELGPWGQHLMLLLQGERNDIKHSLPLDYIITERTDPVGTTPGEWRGSAMLPPGYFPPNVTLMNAYAIHGVDDKRKYQALYAAPQDDPEYPNPDFHRLDLFRAIDFEFQLKDNKNYSQVWLDAMGSEAPAPTTEAVMTTSLSLFPGTFPAEPTNTLPPESFDIFTIVPEESGTQQPSLPDTTESTDSSLLEPTDPSTQNPKNNARHSTNTGNPESSNMLAVKVIGTDTAEPTENLPVNSPELTNIETTEAAFKDSTTLPPSIPAPTTLPEPLETSTSTQSPGKTGTAVRRRPHPQRVNPSQNPANFIVPNMPGRPRRRPVPSPLRVRPNRQGSNQKPLSQQRFPLHFSLSPDEDAFIQRFLQQHNLELLAPSGQDSLTQQNQHRQFPASDQQFRASVGHPFLPPRNQQFQPPRNQQFQPPRNQQFQPPRNQQFQPPRNQQFQPPRNQQFQPPRNQQFQPPRDEQLQSPRDEQFQPPRDEEFQPPRDEQFQPPRDEQFQPPRDEQFQPPRDEQFQPPRDEQFQPPHDEQFQPPRDEQFQPPRDEQFQPPRDEQSQPPRDEQFQPPRDELFQPPRDQQFQPPRDQESQRPSDQESQPPHDQEFQLPRNQESQPPRDQEFQPPRDQEFLPPRDGELQTGDQKFSAPQNEQEGQLSPRPSPAGEQQFPTLREGDAPLDVGEEDIGLQEMEKVLASLTEGSPALPPAHPRCFSPGLVPDEQRCWVFHECELEDGQWQVYSWKCIKGHVFDPLNMACVPGRCRRRG